MKQQMLEEYKKANGTLPVEWFEQCLDLYAESEVERRLNNNK